MIKNNLLIIILMSLSACTTFNYERPPLERPKIEIPLELKDECEDIPKLRNNTMGELLAHDSELIIMYTECRLRHKRLKEAIEKAL